MNRDGIYFVQRNAFMRSLQIKTKRKDTNS